MLYLDYTRYEYKLANIYRKLIIRFQSSKKCHFLDQSEIRYLE